MRCRTHTRIPIQGKDFDHCGFPTLRKLSPWSGVPGAVGGSEKMGDILCAKCAEPWDAYGVRHGDMSRQEADKFSRGKGCPICNFGTECASCGGTGKERSYGRDTCQTCMGSTKVLARRLLRESSGRWSFGYIPNVKVVPISAEDGLMRELRPAKESRDGLFVEAWFRCWSCDPPPCEYCNGDGKLHQSDPDETMLTAARSAVEESDEEPIGILARRGLL
jgi:hypothetical protein